MEQIGTPVSYYRGGTSKALFVKRGDLPTADDAELDAWILAIYGSPDRRQIDGMGGADPLTSKFAIIGPPSRPDADVDYSFFQVGIEEARVFRDMNCGNITAAVGPFAIDEGIVVAMDGVQTVRIHATNFDKIIYADVPVENGRAKILGAQHIDGVPGAGAPIHLDWRDTAGGHTGRAPAADRQSSRHVARRRPRRLRHLGRRSRQCRRLPPCRRGRANGRRGSARDVA